ncbi:MAG: hypothetical protein LC749_15155, partial [Actinobacteria bacterium]|nr:hypothetical protein [Actinomycetota bacterium]
SDHQSPDLRPPSRVTSATAARFKRNVPSPGGQISGMAGHKHGLAGRVDRVGHPVDLPPGLPRGDPGTELTEVAAGRIEGCPRIAARSGSARSTGCPTTPACMVCECRRRTGQQGTAL